MFLYFPQILCTSFNELIIQVWSNHKQIITCTSLTRPSTDMVLRTGDMGTSFEGDGRGTAADQDFQKEVDIIER